VVLHDLNAWLKLISIDNREDGNVVVEAGLRCNDRVVIIDNFLELRDWQRHSAHLLNGLAFFSLLLVLRFKQLLVTDEFLFKQNVVLHSLLSQKTQATLLIGSDLGQFVVVVTGDLLLFAASSGGASFLLALLLLLAALAFFLSLLGRLIAAGAAGHTSW